MAGSVHKTNICWENDKGKKEKNGKGRLYHWKTFLHCLHHILKCGTIWVVFINNMTSFFWSVQYAASTLTEHRKDEGRSHVPSQVLSMVHGNSALPLFPWPTSLPAHGRLFLLSVCMLARGQGGQRKRAPALGLHVVDSGHKSIYTTAAAIDGSIDSMVRPPGSQSSTWQLCDLIEWVPSLSHHHMALTWLDSGTRESTYARGLAAMLFPPGLPCFSGVQQPLWLRR